MGRLGGQVRQGTRRAELPEPDMPMVDHLLLLCTIPDKWL